MRAAHSAMARSVQEEGRKNNPPYLHFICAKSSTLVPAHQRVDDRVCVFVEDHVRVPCRVTVPQCEIEEQAATVRELNRAEVAGVVLAFPAKTFCP